MYTPKNDTKDTELDLLPKTSDGKQSKTGRFDPEAQGQAETQQPQAATGHSNLGIILTLISVFCNLGFSALRKLIPEVSSTQYMFDRAFCSLTLLTIYFYYKKELHVIKEKLEVRMCGIGIGSGISDCCYFVALMGLSMGEMTTILAMMAIFNGIIANIVLGDPYLRIEKILGGVSFIGVFFIVRPPFLFGSEEAATPVPGEDTQQAVEASVVIPRFLAALIALAVAFAWSSLRVAIRSVKDRIPPIMIAYFINLMVVIMFGSYFILTWSHKALTLKQLIMIVASSVLHISETVLVSKALAIERPSVIGIVGYSQLVASPIFDLVLFGILPSFYTILGASFIIGSCVKLIMVKK